MVTRTYLAPASTIARLVFRRFDVRLITLALVKSADHFHL